MENTVQNTIEIVFAGVDEFNRPTFLNASDNHRFYCDTDNLFDYGTVEEAVMGFYASNPGMLRHICYKGRMFDSEPDGTPVNVTIISAREAKSRRK